MDNYKKLYEYKWLMRIIATIIIALVCLLNVQHYSVGYLSGSLMILCVAIIIVLYYLMSYINVHIACWIVAVSVMMLYQLLLDCQSRVTNVYSAIALYKVITDAVFCGYLIIFVIIEISRNKDVSVRMSLYEVLCPHREHVKK